MQNSKLFFLLTIIFVGITISGFTQKEGNDFPVTAQKVWETTDLLTTAESVCFDKENKVLYVSCINGNPTDKDGNGFISKLSLAGEIITLNWIEGLNAPKGMGIYGGKLFVTDIDEVVEIDIQSSALVKKYPVDKAKFLNDITIDYEGNVYISDMSTAKIHRIKKGIVETWFTSEEFVGPNGLFYEDKEILVGTKKGIYSVRIEDKRLWLLIKDTGSIDGLESDGMGNYIISDWSGKVQLVSTENDPVVLFDTSKSGVNAADIEYIIDDRLLLIPTFLDNRVAAYKLVYK